MKLLLYGVSGNTVSLEDQNKYLIDQKTAQNQIFDLKQYDGVEGIIVLSNHYRTEYYLHVDELSFSHGDFLRYLSEYSGKKIGEVILETYSKFNADAIRHLLYVLSGMDAGENKEGDLMKSAEEALQMSRICGNCAGMMLSPLFEKAVDFSSQMQSLPSMASLHSEETGTVVRTFLNEWPDLSKRRFLLAGHSPNVLRTAKVLFRMGARHISIANTEKSISEMMAADLEHWEKRFFSGSSKRVFFPVGINHILYSLSSSDGIAIFDDSLDTLMSNKFEHHLKEIRPYKKKQLMLELSDSVSKSRQEKNTGLTVFTSENLFSSQKYLQEEIESARKVFEETTELEAENIFSWYQSVVAESLSMMNPSLLV